MWNKLKLENFRGFDAIEIKPLRRVNLLFGSNNTGKTSLLEAAFLLRGFFNPQLPVALNSLRGRRLIELTPTEIWGWLFNNKTTNLKSSICATSDNLEERLTLQLEPAGSLTQSTNGNVVSPVSSSSTAELLELHCKYSTSNNEEHETRSQVIRKPSGELDIAFKGTQFRTEATTHFITSRHLIQSDDVKLFSELQKKKRKRDVLEWLKRFDDRIQDVALDHEGPEAGVILDMGLPEYIPMLLAGEGTVRFTSILLRLLSMRAGTLLLDEAESGLHHSALPLLWSAVFKLAKATDSQIIATTHSWECLAAAHKAAKEQGPYELSGFRLERSVGNTITCTALGEENLEFGIKAGAEMR